MAGIIRRIIRLAGNRKSHYSELEASLHYYFSDKALIRRALTHRSLSTFHHDNYERLEFLGDSIIESILTAWLYHKYPEAHEGLLTKYRSSLVNKHFLAVVGRSINLGKYILTERCVNLEDDKVKNNIVADVFEALIGAIFIDGGIRSAKKSILKTVLPKSHLANHKNNYKGRLIEYCHKNHLDGPHFSIHDSVGPEHEKIFNIDVRIDDDKLYHGSGKSKKEAEQNSAMNALNDLSWMSPAKE